MRGLSSEGVYHHFRLSLGIFSRRLQHRDKRTLAPCLMVCLTRLIGTVARMYGQGLEPVFSACPGLHTLKLSSCSQLRADALSALLPCQAAPQLQAGQRPECRGCGPAATSTGAARLPDLRELDVSYCPLPTSALADLLADVSRLEVRKSWICAARACSISLTKILASPELDLSCNGTLKFLAFHSLNSPTGFEQHSGRLPPIIPA